MGKMKTLIKTGLWSMASLILLSCASEDTPQKGESKLPEKKFVATFTGNQPKTTSLAKSRTIATYTKGVSAQVLWESTDKIWVKADNGNFYQSAAADFAASGTPTNYSRANFGLTEGSYMKFNPEVRYTNTNSPSIVVISNNQSQGYPNTFFHLGESGDCGTAIAKGGGNDHEFTLNHKASYLCFLPRCMNTALGPNIKLTKIVVKADKDIAGTYNFANGSLMGTITGASKTITLTLGGTRDFSLNTTTENIAMNGSYMVIAPGTYNLTIAYTIQDVNGISTDITKTLNGFTCPEGQIMDIRANLTPQALNFSKYYMWDAKFDYWYNHLKPDGTPDGNYPKFGTHDPRWEAETYHGYGVRYDAQTERFKVLPNANELFWYAKKGDPRWDAQGGVTVVNDHLQHFGGLWLRKKHVILAHIKANEGYPATLTWADLKEAYWDSPTAPHVDYRSTHGSTTLYDPPRTPPANTTDYFFLPALGEYSNGILYDFGTKGYYFSLSTYPVSFGSYGLTFSNGHVGAGTVGARVACSVVPFE